MSDYFSPDEVRNFISRASNDRQRLILFLTYNYGISVNEMMAISANQFMIKRDFILFNFTRKKTNKKHTYKIIGDNYRLFYRVIKKLQPHDPLLHKDKNLPISEALLKKDLFDLAVETNRKITPGAIFDSHLYWLFKRGMSFSQAVEEYGIPLTGRQFKIWEQAVADGRVWPLLLD